MGNGNESEKHTIAALREQIADLRERLRVVSEENTQIPNLRERLRVVSEENNQIPDLRERLWVSAKEITHLKGIIGTFRRHSDAFIKSAKHLLK